MRLTSTQQTTICTTVATIVGGGARVWLFGSRCNDELKGGDVDLLIEHDVLPSILQRAKVKLALESSLIIPVDVIAMKRGMPPSAFQQIALATGIPLVSAR